MRFPYIAVAAATLVAFLPAKTVAERPPIHPLEPPSGDVVYDDTDPWRPDADQPSAAQGSRVQVSVANEPSASRVQPISRPPSWYQVLLRVMRAFFLGGAAR